MFDSSRRWILRLYYFSITCLPSSERRSLPEKVSQYTMDPASLGLGAASLAVQVLDGAMKGIICRPLQRTVD